MNYRRKCLLRNMLTAYRNEMCEYAMDEASDYDKVSKCDVCGMIDSDGACRIDAITLKLENDIWEVR